MYDQEDAAISALLNDGLDTADPDEILARLDAELAVQTDEMSATLSADTPGWLAGTGSAARRFINFYADAIREEICANDRSGLNEQYKTVLGGLTIQDQVRSLIPAVLTILGVGSSFINPMVIASLVAIWLVRVGADRWCRLPAPVEQPAAAATSDERPATNDA